MSEALEARVRQLELDLIEERHRRETLEKKLDDSTKGSRRDLNWSLAPVLLLCVANGLAAGYAVHWVLQLKERALIF